MKVSSCHASTGSETYPQAHFKIAQAVLSTDHGQRTPREPSPPAQKYADQKGYATMTSPSIYGPLFFVQLDNNPDGIDVAFEEVNLGEVSPLED